MVAHLPPMQHQVHLNPDKFVTSHMAKECKGKSIRRFRKSYKENLQETHKIPVDCMHIPTQRKRSNLSDYRIPWFHILIMAPFLNLANTWSIIVLHTLPPKHFPTVPMLPLPTNATFPQPPLSLPASTAWRAYWQFSKLSWAKKLNLKDWCQRVSNDWVRQLGDEVKFDGTIRFLRNNMQNGRCFRLDRHGWECAHVKWNHD